MWIRVVEGEEQKRETEINFSSPYANGVLAK